MEIDDKKVEYIGISVTAKEKAEIQAAADADDSRPLAAWCRNTLLKAAKTVTETA